MANPTEYSRCEICNIVKLKGIINIWRKLAGGFEKKLARDVPRGHIAVIVGAGKRVLIRADYLNHPILRELLEQAYEEYGHNKNGPLTIPCDELFFQDIIHFIRGDVDVSPFSYSKKDSTPLLQGFVGICMLEQ